MRDPYFEHTVVLVWHHDADGAVGVVVNRVIDETLAHIFDDPPADIDSTSLEDTHIAWGGPVEGGVGTVVVRGHVPDSSGHNLSGDLGVTHSMEVLMELMRSRESPFLLCLGYAGWGPGQLEAELTAGGWLWTDCDASLVFDVAPEDRYDRALASLGLTRTTVWMQPIDE